MYHFLTLKTIEPFVPLMERKNVSTVARSARGFLTAYRKARGKPESLTDHWWRTREAFIARHEAQRKLNREPLFDEDCLPTRRHLALIAWAYSPTPERFLKL
jgi:hypothetical protein